MNKVHVSASTKEYDVIVGSGLNYGELLGAIHPICRLMIVTDDTVEKLYLDQSVQSFTDAGFGVETFVFPHGEQSKNIEVAERLMVEMVEKEITKTDLLVALGGGVVGDLTGFVASVFLRGMNFLQLPTTLLAAVDSSVGGKTAVDLINGKNMVGAFHQPVGVFCDIDTFKTLPEATYAEGMAESIKYGIIYDEELFTRMEKREISDEDLVARCVQIKAEVVAKDEFDKGPRHILNFGHTLGHAIETKSGYTIGHGQGVAIGMAAVCGAMLGKEEFTRVLNVLKDYHLPANTEYDRHELALLSKADKKRHGDVIRVVLPARIGEVFLKDVTVEEWEEIVKGGLKAVEEN